MTAGAKTDAELDEDALRNLVEEYKALVRDAHRQRLPDGSGRAAVGRDRSRVAVVDAQEGRRLPARERHLRRPRHRRERRRRWCSATSATTRAPASRSRAIRRPARSKFYGEFLVNAQGEDVVAGIRTPLDIDEMAKRLPEAYAELLETQDRLERHFRDMQDIEFTVERGKLYLLQTRTGKRTAAAAVRIATRHGGRRADRHATAVLRVAPEQLDQLLHPVIDPAFARRRSAPGFRRARARRAASPCSIPTSPSSARAAGDSGDPRARRDDAGGFSRHRRRARGAHRARRHDEPRGGRRARHGQVRGRRLQGHARRRRAPPLQRRRRTRSPKATGSRVDGATGRVYRGDLPTMPSEVVQVIRGMRDRSQRAASISRSRELLGWADEVRRLQVRANADTPHDARIARGFGAEGIGLCRTEHMFFEGDRITAMREMIVARDEGGRRRALAKLLPMQRARLRGNLRGDGRAAGDDPAARSAAARVPAARRRGEQAARAHARHAARRADAHRGIFARDQPDARASRLPARHHLSRDHRNAGPGDLRGRGPSETTRHRRPS